jgi:penicillin amidase
VRRSTRVAAYLFVILLASGCEMQVQDLITSLPANETYHASALQHEAHVVRTEAGVPHIYAKTRHDAGYLLGFTQARDRFFMMDLARRLGEGTITEFLGDNGLDSDIQSRLGGITYLADGITAALDTLGDGTWGDYVDAYIAGVNDYVAAVKAGTF